jgi:hypothetical protein
LLAPTYVDDRSIQLRVTATLFVRLLLFLGEPLFFCGARWLGRATLLRNVKRVPNESCESLVR